jgi:hypothetical protein
MNIPQVSDYTDRLNRSVTRILETFERSSTRLDQQYGRTRKHERKPFRGLLSLFVPTEDRQQPPFDGSGCLTCWCHSLSSGGVGLILPGALQTTDVFVGVHLPNKAIRWFRGDIVRCKEIPEESFYDYGIRFRTQSPTAESTLATASA